MIINGLLIILYAIIIIIFLYFINNKLALFFADLSLKKIQNAKDAEDWLSKNLNFIASREKLSTKGVYTWKTLPEFLLPFMLYFCLLESIFNYGLKIEICFIQLPVILLISFFIISNTAKDIIVSYCMKIMEEDKNENINGKK
jgi:hypothetical protein